MPLSGQIGHLGFVPVRLSSMISQIIGSNIFKRIAIIISLIFLPVMCMGQVVSSQLLLTELPKMVGIVVKVGIQQKTGSDGGGWYFSKKDYVRISDSHTGFYIECPTPRIFSADPYFPSIFLISNMEFIDLPMRSRDIRWISNSVRMEIKAANAGPQFECVLKIEAEDRRMPKTVGDAKDYFQGMLDFINLDPYSNLDQDTAVAILMKKITTAMADNQYKEALMSFFLLEQRESNLPEGFAYFYAKALKESGYKDLARRYCDIYLRKYGRSGKYYVEVVTVMAGL